MMARAQRRIGAPVRRRMSAISLQSLMPGGYYGARGEAREFREWHVTDSGPHGDLLGDLEALRARSRDLERNEPLAGGAVQTIIDGVVGWGLTPKPRIDRELLGLDDATASQWESDVARIWWAWAGRPGCDIGGRNTFASLTEQAFRESLSGGDAFVLRRYAPRPGDLFGLKVQVLEAARISTPDGMVESDSLRAGVKLDRDGRAISYFASDRYPAERFFNGSPLTWRELPARDRRGQPLCLHVYKQVRPDQVRGVPYLAPVIALLKQLSRYSHAELMAAVVGSMFTVFVKNAIGADEGLAPIDPEAEGTNPTPASDYRLASGAIVDLQEGEDVEFANPARPNAQFEPFVQAMVRQIGVALGIPFEVLIKHFTASYSASRAALIQAWHTFLTRRSWLVASCCQPVYEWVLDEAIARGMLAAPGWLDNPLLRVAWSSAEWTGPVMPSIDPVKDVTAAKARIDLRISTRERETAQLNGEDWEEVFAQSRKEEQMLREAGMTAEVDERIQREPRSPDSADDTADDDTETDPQRTRDEGDEALANV